MSEYQVIRMQNKVVVKYGDWETTFIVLNLKDAEYIRRAKGIKAMEDKSAASDDKYS